MHQLLLACQTAQTFCAWQQQKTMLWEIWPNLVQSIVSSHSIWKWTIFQSVSTNSPFFSSYFSNIFCVKATVSNWPPFNCDITVFKLASRQVALPHNICKRHQFDCLDIWFIHYFIILSKSSSIRQCLSIIVIFTFCQRFITSNVLAPILNSCLLRKRLPNTLKSLFHLLWNEI